MVAFLEKKKRIIICYLCISFLTLSFYNFCFTKKVYADALSLSAITSELFIGETFSAASATLCAAAPYAMAIVGAGLACGIIYHNRVEINSFVCGAYNNLVNNGIKFGKDIFGYGATCFISAKAKVQLLKYVNNRVREKISFTNSLKVSSSKIVWTNKFFKLHRFLNLSLISNMSNYENQFIRPVFKIGDKIIKSFSSVGSGVSCFFDSGRSEFSLNGGTISSSYEGQSVCIGFENTHNDRSINLDIDQVLNPSDPLRGTGLEYPSTTSMSADGITSLKWNPSISWDSVLSMPYADVFTTDTVVDSIPTDIPSDGALDLTLPNDVTLNFEPLKLSLENKFPFCIPFDLVNSIKALNATPSAPVWEINFPDNYFIGGCSLKLDFSIFNEWANIIRWGILVSFNVFLILVTRRVIK